MRLCKRELYERQAIEKLEYEWPESQDRIHRRNRRNLAICKNTSAGGEAILARANRSGRSEAA